MCALRKKNSYNLQQEAKRLSTNGQNETFRTEESYCEDSNDDVDEAERNRGLSVVPSVLYDIFIYSDDSNPDLKKTLLFLQHQHNYVCCDQNNFIPGETYFDNFANLMEISKRLVLVVSKQLLDCKISVYFIKMAVQYHTEQQNFQITVLLDDVDKSKIPVELRCFPIVKTKGQKQWFLQLLEIVKGNCQYRDASVCPSTGHADASKFVDQSNTAMSDPLPFIDISASLKRKNKILEKTMLAKNLIQPEHIEQLKTVVPSIKIDYNKNMEFFYRLKNKKKRVFEAVIDYKTSKIRVHAGDILEVIDTTLCKKAIMIANATGDKGKVPHKVVLPILAELPSIIVNKLSSSITEDENREFQQEIQKLGRRVVQAVDTAQASNYIFQINRDDFLCVLDESSDRVKVRNCRGQEGWVVQSVIGNVVETPVERHDKRL